MSYRGKPTRPGPPNPDERVRRPDHAPDLAGTRPMLELGKAVPGAAARPKPFRIAGLPAVAALFAQDPDRVERLFYDERMKWAVGDFTARLAARRKPYRMVPPEELEKVAGTVLHGGVVAVSTPRPVLPFDLEEARGWAAGGKPLLLLDGVGNPNNLGAIVRTAAFFGLDRIVISDHPSQGQPSESAYRVAEGGFEHVQLYRAERFATQLAGLGSVYRTVGTALGGHAPLLDLPSEPGRPVAVVLGNEEHGMPTATERACSEVVVIPGAGWVQSLNVSATAAILAFLMTRGIPR